MILPTNKLNTRDTPVSERVEVFCGLAILLSLLLLGYCIWILDRAFELTDESYYLLLAIHPGAVIAYNSGQHWVANSWDARLRN